jgi:antitoxin HicB
MDMQEYNYTVLFEPAEEGGYIVHVPALNGLTTEGDTLEQAREMALDAIKGYLEVLVERGSPIPADIPMPQPLVQKLAVAI